MSEEQLKPCPFCGSGNVGNGRTAVWWVSCYSCSADGPTADTELEAAEQWNHAPRTSDVAALHSTANLLETVFAETAQELGCKQDNEAVLEAIAALRARAVPAIVWNRFPMASRAQVGAFRFTVEWLYQGNSTMRWRWWIDMGDTRVANGSELGYATCEEAEGKAVAAFLRMVGCKS